jgi:hypothetical protein
MVETSLSGSGGGPGKATTRGYPTSGILCVQMQHEGTNGR